MAVLNTLNLSGKTAEQKKILKKYFFASGCIGSLTAMKDEAYDELVKQRVASIGSKAKALSKIGLDESQINEINPINFSGYNFDGEYYAKLGKDGKLRSSKYQITWIFCSATQVYVYISTFDMTEDSKKEQTEEYFYKDITNFSTTTETVEYYQGLSKRTKDVSRFAIVVPGDKLYCSMQGTQENERAVQAMKQKLREKKQ